MGLKHLSEDEIQEYLDNPVGESSGAVRNHLENCPECRRVFGDYQKLYSGLNRDDIPGLSVSFADRVMTEIEALEPVRDKRDAWIPIFAGSMILLGLSAIFYVIDFSAIFGLLQAGDFSEALNFTALRKLLGAVDIFGLNIKTILAVGLILLATFGVDFAVRYSRKKPVTFVV